MQPRRRESPLLRVSNIGKLSAQLRIGRILSFAVRKEHDEENI
jgi:hypothetical protein